KSGDSVPTTSALSGTMLRRTSGQQGAAAAGWERVNGIRRPVFVAAGSDEGRATLVGGSGCGRWQHPGRHVESPAEILHDGGDRPDGTPRNAPPAQEKGDEREWDALGDGAVAGADEVDVGSTLERHHDDRNAVLKNDEARSGSDFCSDLLGGHVFDAADGHASSRSRQVAGRALTCETARRQARATTAYGRMTWVRPSWLLSFSDVVTPRANACTYVGSTLPPSTSPEPSSVAWIFTLGCPCESRSRSKTASGYPVVPSGILTVESAGKTVILARTCPRASTISRARPRSTGTTAGSCAARGRAKEAAKRTRLTTVRAASARWAFMTTPRAWVQD